MKEAFSETLPVKVQVSGVKGKRLKKGQAGV
jgi:hypothetical protein